jgi:small subunit ribosomal protein S21
MRASPAAALAGKQGGSFLAALQCVRYNDLYVVMRRLCRVRRYYEMEGGDRIMSVDLRPGESQDSLLKRFRKAVAEARILPIVRQKRWFTSKSEVRRIKRQKAIRKSQRPPRYER